MKIVPKKSTKKQEGGSPLLNAREFLESLEDHHSNDESPEDNSDLESQASPPR